MPQTACSQQLPRAAACTWHALQQQLAPLLCSIQHAEAAQGATAAAAAATVAAAVAANRAGQGSGVLRAPMAVQQPWPSLSLGPVQPPRRDPLWSPWGMHPYASQPVRAALPATYAAAQRRHCATSASTPAPAKPSPLPTTNTPAAAASVPPSAHQHPAPRISSPGAADAGPAAVDTVWSLPNMLSIGRGLSGPGIAYLILQEQWPWALGTLAVSGLSDWADGALARRMGTSSVLGSYLDPLGDKVLVGCVVGALAAQGALPPWVATLIIGRDVALVGGMFVVRWRSLGWRTPWSTPPLTRAQFFRTADAAPAPVLGARGLDVGASKAAAADAQQQQQQQQGQGQGVAVDDAGVPFMRPLLISKVNTVLQLSLVGGCVSKAWLAWPQLELLGALEAFTAAATALSMGAYAWQASKLLDPK